METQIFMTISIVLAVGIAGGIMLAMAFDLDARNRQRRQRRAKRKARHEKRMRKITTNNA
jgi:beta-lactamase regulating signal transducer with metallopeptidase domain